MPLYEYRCKACGHQFEKIQSFSAPEEKICPVCGGEVERLLSAPAVQFKGSGWYVTDYAAKSGSKTAPATGSTDGNASKTEGKPAASSEGGASASKSESASSPSPASKKSE
ncbi:zinc ribbon domain-containing protein [Alloacidobacterium sp.]|uniref:FmdB family zinc ribbon protein n=1 Tax=Alloacidobacterium sp. TaxID=2951999 RepID=UPI002D641829|nr:zinc ribbon domain-containing protein [Alloacidobacterium sp.]HYK37158.1 zinc ribbon domain-containing protein [Alloacidobacterium sp.]